MGFGGRRGQRQLFQGNKGLKMSGTGEQKKLCGTGNIGN